MYEVWQACNGRGYCASRPYGVVYSPDRPYGTATRYVSSASNGSPSPCVCVCVCVCHCLRGPVSDTVSLSVYSVSHGAASVRLARLWQCPLITSVAASSLLSVPVSV